MTQGWKPPAVTDRFSSLFFVLSICFSCLFFVCFLIAFLRPRKKQSVIALFLDLFLQFLLKLFLITIFNNYF